MRRTLKRFGFVHLGLYCRGDLYDARLQGVWFNRQHRLVYQPGHVVGDYGGDGRYANLARYRRDCVDHGYCGGCQRIDLCAGQEELEAGLNPHAAIVAGFDRAFITILDSHLTTMLVAAILFAIGTGPIKGFAATLFVGISTSLFSAIVGSRSMINLIYGRRNVTKLHI